MPGTGGRAKSFPASGWKREDASVVEFYFPWATGRLLLLLCLEELVLARAFEGAE